MKHGNFNTPGRSWRRSALYRWWAGPVPWSTGREADHGRRVTVALLSALIILSIL